MNKQFVVITSGEHKSRFFVARKLIGRDDFRTICTATNEVNATLIADAMNASLKRADVVSIAPAIKQRKRA